MAPAPRIRGASPTHTLKMKFKHKHLYITLPVLLLKISTTIQFTTTYLASRGNAAEVERDYYDRAVEWDAYQAEVAASEALG